MAIHYTETQYSEMVITDVAAYLTNAPTAGILWLNVNGLGDVSILRTLGQHFGLHELALEDVLNVPQRPKLEDHETYMFGVLQMAQASTATMMGEQVSLFLGPAYVLTIQEGMPGDVFEPVRQRLRQRRGKIRSTGADYLFYALFDAVVDGLFPLLDTLGDRLVALEDAVLSHPERQHLEEIYAVRRLLSTLRRNLRPLREAVHALTRSDSALVTDQTRFFAQDCYDHALQVLDVLESYREMATGLLETYLSLLSHRLSEVMKVLTIISTIFIPLTFVVGIYGMNFNAATSPWNMPELQWYWGYPVILLLMAGLAGVLVVFFRRKGWL